MGAQPSRERSIPGGNGSGRGDEEMIRNDSAPPRLSVEAAYELGSKLWFASLHGNTAEARRLILMGAPVNWQDVTGWAPLHRACIGGNTELVMLLIEHKAYINIKDMFPNTPIIWAARNNHMAIVRVLVEAGADITVCGHKNKTAAEAAEELGHHAVAKYLTTFRFHPSARNEIGQLFRFQGRSKRSIGRDLKEFANFDDHMLYRLKHFCIGKQ